MKELLTGLIFSFAIAYAAYKKKSLSLSGLIGAVILGTGLYYFGGLYLSTIMISFFVSSTLLTKFKMSAKTELEDINEKGGERDIFQVMANGSLGLIFALLYYFLHSDIFLVVFAAAFAASNADTWASELGVLSCSQPISILSFKRVEKGQSGAVSSLGTFAAFSGAVFIAAVFSVGYIIKFGYNPKLILFALVVILSGFAGSIIDSLIGAAFQVKYKCQSCGKLTEKRHHHGKPAVRLSGIAWINNDAVNFISGLFSCAAAAVLYLVIL